ncbi:MAG TPA: GGDEF domain-containing protein [Burkholderiaceae bacterium]|jgi:GGDEF domain-containing protein/Tfp pilus assembly protein PilF
MTPARSVVQRAALGVLLCLCLGACQKEGRNSAAFLPLSSAAASGSSQDGEALWTELENIERAGRTKPEDYAARLQVLLAGTVPGSVERAEILALRGMLLGLDRSRAGVDQISAELASWPKPGTLPDVTVAQAVASGTFSYAQGDLREATKTLMDLDPAILAKASVLQQIRAHSLMARVLSEAGKINEALRHGQQQLTLATRLGVTWRRAAAFNDIGICYYRADQATPANEAVEQGLQLARQDPDPALMYGVLNLRAILHSNDAEGSVAHDSLLEALSYAEKSGDDGQRALLLSNLADNLLRHGQYAQALQMAQSALPLARQTHRLVAEIGARHNGGLAKIALGRVAEGREEVRLAITMDEQNGSASYAADDWRELGQYLEKAGDFSGAIDAYHEHRRLLDQVLRDDTRKAVVEAQEHFEAERRAAEIELLNRDNTLKSEQIRARDLELGLWGVLAGCVVLGAMLLALAYQRIRKTNSALAVTNARLKVQSERDPLTGLANRRYFQAAIKALASEAEGGRLSGTVFLIDIDHFKRINDVHGHAAGDSVLVEVARRLTAALREDDLVVRWGGEEFLIVVKGEPELAETEEATPADDGNIARPFVDSRALEPGSAQALAQRLLDLIGTESIGHGDLSVSVTASIGFASFPIEPHGLSLNWERAIDLVDTVMYIAKAHGRNKAYGIACIDAADDTQVAEIAPRMEAAWQSGQVKLIALNGPTPAATAKQETPA